MLLTLVKFIGHSGYYSTVQFKVHSQVVTDKSIITLNAEPPTNIKLKMSTLVVRRLLKCLTKSALVNVF